MSNDELWPAWVAFKNSGGGWGRSPHAICNQNEIINVIKGAEKCGS